VIDVTSRFALRCILPLALLGTVAAGVAEVGLAFAQLSGSATDFEHCRAIADDAARLRCIESTTGKPRTNSGTGTLGPEAGAWRLVRTPNPSGGPDAVSIMQTADTTRSDFDLAGLAVRCQDGGVEVLIVLVGALSLRSHPKVAVSAGGKSMDFTATVVPPGASLLLPKTATELASRLWTATSEMTVQIETGQNDSAPGLIRGVVPLKGLSSALPSLLAICSTQ
jgi:hypothetical protein